MDSLHGSASASTEILNSWKEIAAYLDRGVRTVQRWEAELRLPVRRPSGRGRSAVIAMRSEIDLWLRSCPLEKRQKHAVADGPPVPADSVLFCRELLSASRRLRADVFRSRHELSTALHELCMTVRKMTVAPRFDANVSSAPARAEGRTTGV
jgi:hypothetical protein